MARRVLWAWGFLAAVFGAGCGRSSAPLAGTGADAAARGYYEALLRQDWAGAYGFLHPDSRARCDAEHFSRLAQNHRRSLGFEPEAVRPRSCEEQGDQATARATFTGQSQGRRRYSKDAVALRRGEAGWGVVLPPRFGQPR